MGKHFPPYLRLAKRDSFSFLLSKATDFLWDLGEFMTHIKLAMVIAYSPQFSSRGKNCVKPIRFHISFQVHYDDSELHTNVKVILQH